METALTGALRREKMVEAEVRRLEAEIKHMNRLVYVTFHDALLFNLLEKFID